jgi:DNA-binding CsgD family transcriptional regulator
VSNEALTRREHEVVTLVAEGLTNAEIACRLWISPGTVRKHLENVFAKLGVHTRTAAVARIRATAIQP